MMRMEQSNRLGRFVGLVAMIAVFGTGGSAALGQIPLDKLTANDAAEWDQLGRSVSISDDIAIVGTYYGYPDGGSAYLFDVATGEQLFKLTANDAAEGDLFGCSVSISGDITIVGAHYNAGCGSAYLFDVTTGQQLFKLTADDAEAGDYFGWSVSISGDIAIVGARRDDGGGDESGSAYLFDVTIDVTTGRQLFKLTADDAEAGDRFGWSVSISDDIAIVGAPYNDDGGDASGSAYLYWTYPDCNLNDYPDHLDILEGTSLDCNINGIPDDCEGIPHCREDLACPNSVEQQDLNAVLNRWGAPACEPGGSAYPCPEDLAAPDGVEQQDLNAVLNRWGDPSCEPDPPMPLRGKGKPKKKR